VRVRASDDPVPDERVGEPSNCVVPSGGRCNPAAEKSRDVRRSGTAVALILRRRRDAESLADVLLVDTDHEISLDDPVVSFDHDGRLILERADPGARSHEPGMAGGGEAEMLIEIVIVEPGNGGLEDVGRRGPARRHAPASVAVQKRRLGLRSREAELARERAS
jgi:hypothetical protein